MSVKRVDPDEAAELMKQGWALVDVRSIPEFEGGHPEGAYNCPLFHQSRFGMAPNPEFLAVLARQFGTEQQLILSCQAGVRSLRAAEVLLEAGFQQVIDMRGGWGGERAEDGSVCLGWRSRGLPVAGIAKVGRSYRELSE